jgi:glycerol uptake facilitator-like aquaporin
VVSGADFFLGGLRVHELAAYVVAQLTGACFGVVVANLMFSLPAISIASHTRGVAGLWLGEVVATFGLILVVFGVTRSGRSGAAPIAVGAYITGAYFFTSSTSFANPAVTLARMLSDTFAGIAPASVLPFIVAQLTGTVVAGAAVRVLWPRAGAATEVIVPHETPSQIG